MRKSLVALAIACAFPAAYAQQSVNPTAALPGPIPTTARTQITLYGLVDGGLEYQNVGDINTTRLSSGMSAGSRWGIRGIEALSNGWDAIFTLESRFELDTGRMTNQGPLYFCKAAGAPATTPAVCPGVVQAGPLALPPANIAAIVGGMNAVNDALLGAVTTVNGAGALFDRQAFAGLITPVGAVAFGRMYTPGYEILNKFNAFGDSTAGQMGQGYANLKIRANNALMYRAELKGFAASAMYGFGGTDALRNERSVGPADGDDFWGLNVQYNGEMFGVGVGYNHDNVVPYAGQAAGTPETKTGLTTLNVGGTLTFGGIKVFGQYMQRKNDNPMLTPRDIQNIVLSTGGNLTAITGILGSVMINPWDIDGIRGVAGNTDTSIYHLGVNWRLGNGTLMGAYNYAKDTARSAWQTSDAEVNHFSVAYFYDLSRRTQLYGVAAFANNTGSARMALGAAGYAGGWTTGQGTNAQAYQAGLRHTF